MQHTHFQLAEGYRLQLNIAKSEIRCLKDDRSVRRSHKMLSYIRDFRASYKLFSHFLASCESFAKQRKRCSETVCKRRYSVCVSRQLIMNRSNQAKFPPHRQSFAVSTILFPFVQENKTKQPIMLINVPMCLMTIKRPSNFSVRRPHKSNKHRNSSLLFTELILDFLPEYMYNEVSTDQIAAVLTFQI